MTISRIAWFFCTASLFLGSCSFQTNTFLGKNRQTQVAIADLADENYHYCSDPSPNPYAHEEKIDGHRYCFTFTKTDTRVVGSYLYRAPKDVSIICIEGEVNHNQVTGVGYEETSPGAKQYSKKELALLKEFSPSTKLSYWDDVEPYQGGFNLKVASPRLHIFPLIFEDGREMYSATTRYGMIEFDLNGFEQVDKDNLPDYKKCHKTE